MVQNETEAWEHNIYDMLKRDRVAMFATVQTKERHWQPQHNQPHTHSEESVPEANMGWALVKARSGSSQFSEKVKNYLTKKFDRGDWTESLRRTGSKGHAKTHDNQRLFGRKD